MDRGSPFAAHVCNLAAASAQVDNWVYDEANSTFIEDPEMQKRLMDANPNSFRKLVREAAATPSGIGSGSGSRLPCLGIPFGLALQYLCYENSVLAGRSRSPYYLLPQLPDLTQSRAAQAWSNSASGGLAPCAAADASDGL